MNEPKQNYIIWDIDGVFNPFRATNLRERGFIHYRKEWITWDLDLIHRGKWVRELEKYADIIWGSNWGEKSNAIINMFFLKKFSYPHIPLPALEDKVKGTWKLGAVSGWIEENAPVDSGKKVVWVDDETYDDAFEWAKDRDNVLIITPDPAIGLTEEHVDQIKNFLSI